MRELNSLLRKCSMGILFLMLTGIGATAQAQKGPMTIQATAKGTSTQLGKIYNVNIHIDQFSTEDDRQSLIAAFKRSGQQGLVDVLQDMKPKGRVRFASGGVGNDIKYIFEMPSEKGTRRIRLVTDRNLAFGELYHGTRSRDYDVAVIDLVLTPDGKGSGRVLPACKIRMNKKKQQIEVETYQNPWDLTNFMISND